MEDRNLNLKDGSGIFMRGFVDQAIRRRVVIFILTGIATAISLIGVHKLDVDTDVYKYFRQSSPFSVSTKMIGRLFKGVVSLNLVIEGVKEGAFEDPSILRSIEMFQEYADKLPEVGKTVSMVDYLKMINRTLHNNDPDYYVLPKTKEDVAQYLLVYSIADPEKTLNQYVDYERRSAKVLLRTAVPRTTAIINLGRQIEEECNKLFPPEISCKVTSSAYLTSEASQKIAHGIFVSFASAGVAITVVMFFLFRSFKMALISMIPNVLPIAFILGIMGWFGIQFNMGTSIVICMAIGISVDDTITYLVRYFYELKLTNHYLIRKTTGVRITEAQIETIHTASRHVARPIVVTAIAVCLGFIILSFSQFVPVMWYGILTTLTMIISAVFELVILPPLLASISI